MAETTTSNPPVDFRTEPARYKHWRLAFDGPVATLTMDVQEDGGLRPGYELKLNSYDLGVDIELYDALQRLRFEHPEVGAVLLTSGKERVFCAGANIRMLGQSSHGFKVNFCKFTNETRNAMEEASAESPCASFGAPSLTITSSRTASSVTTTSPPRWIAVVGSRRSPSSAPWRRRPRARRRPSRRATSSGRSPSPASWTISSCI